ncbi:hypothetical protein BAUCODRAFT_150900 [Baudoinia panamericana UAMH 10762]|uniref:Yeast cell wall synthesis Kre9/Knh1-like N-terminal domain-containing protein n=1 Tax=Baudoinia panamericana (strain UAMH 10762) TaxID=717646 RepID=M2MAV7_BAUPA|nr:uncharacterized protein BAUCODRAFT_150900 [Baudoinia panamericana UAMH 10762]EMC93601.1 hypothetical protein BAUCODRAFT_150900 [Baudoinia panamericana UAMH 10762]
MFAKALLAGAFAALAAAQSTVLTFTYVPNPMTDGQPQALTYTTNDSFTPVTILLRQGLPRNLETIMTLTTTATGGQFIWTPPTSLPDGSDYALEIMQVNEVNYFGPFVIQGADPNITAYGAAPVSASTSTAMASSTLMYGGDNSTTSTTVPNNSSTWGSMSGTSTVLPRNTTMSMATLTTPSASTTAFIPSTDTASSTIATSTASSSTSAPPSMTTTNSASGLHLVGVVSLLLGVAGVAFCL